MNILIIANDYPYKTSNNYIFVKQLVDKWISFNHKCTVIAPQSLLKLLKNNNLKRPYLVDYNNYKLYSPKFFSFRRLPLLGRLGRYLFNKVIFNTIKKEKIKIDFIYAHFMVPSGVAAGFCANKLNIPYFIAFGESRFNFENFYRKKIIKNTLDKCSGYIAVSQEMKTRLLSLPYNISEAKIAVFPNGFDNNKFYKMDKITARKQLGINSNDFIIIFVGTFIERKGVKRLDQALKEIKNPNIKAIFIGKGKEEPTYKHIIYKGVVKHEEIVKYLNASDIFVLPTINEGSCNAIIEAIACGLPIISSKEAFNDDLLNDSYSLRIDTKNIYEIKNAINKLYKDPNLREKMAKEALNASKKFNLDTRANKIIDFIKTKINDRK